jgi:hypothetical protein
MEYHAWALAALLCAAYAGDALAQSNPRYIPFSPRPVKGALYSPDAGPAPHVGILIVHRTSNFMSYYGCGELAARGYLVLCMNPRSDNNEAAVRWEENALDVKTGMEFLREQPGIRSVLLWGFSGGGGTTSFYQAAAENGTSYCRGPNKLSQCGDELTGLPPADGLILVDTNHGIAHMAILRLNAAVTNDAEIMNDNQLPRMDPTLDPFNPDNGYNEDGASTYSEEFKKRYFEAQARRMNRLIEIAQDKLDAIETRQVPYPDDDVFVVPRTEIAELMRLDPSIHHNTLQPQKLLRNDGQIARQIVASVRLPEPELAAANDTFARGTLSVTLRSFLSANAMRARDSMNDVDYCSSNNSTPCAVQSISVPLLLTAMQANRYLRFNEIHYELAKSEDKDFVIIEGALHPHVPCVACETFPGQYSNVTKNFFDYARDWINERY